jgi:trk system potassium uptake protein TrkH
MMMNLRKQGGFSRRIPTPARLALGLALMVFVSSLILMLPVMGVERPLHPNEAFFTAVSALTVTGLSIITPSTDLSFLGQLVLLILIQAGGVGYMVASVIIFRLLGRSISFADRLALRDSFGLLDMNAILVLVRRVLVTVFALEFVGATLLWFHWQADLGSGRAAVYAIFHAVSAFCNAGFDLQRGESVRGGVPLIEGNQPYPKKKRGDLLSIALKKAFLGHKISFPILKQSRKGSYQIHPRLKTS